MLRFVRLCFGMLVHLFRAWRSLLLENLALRQQLAVLKRRHTRSRLDWFDKLVWVLALVLVCLERNFARCHAGNGDSLASCRLPFLLAFDFPGPKASRGRRGSKEVQDLIFRMVAENPTWGAPRIYGELLMLGSGVSGRTVSRWIRRAPRDPEPAKRWLAFLRNHREAIAAMGFFTVPMITFGVLCCFFVIRHDRRRILHFNITRHLTSL